MASPHHDGDGNHDDNSNSDDGNSNSEYDDNPFSHLTPDSLRISKTLHDDRYTV